MEEFIKELGHHFWGEKSAAFHVIGMFFSLLGTLVIKTYFYKVDKKTSLAEGKVFPKFSMKRWIGDNWLDVIISIIASFLIVRFIDYIFHFMSENNIKIMGYKLSNVDDQVVFYLIAALVIQFFAHKWFKPVRNKK